VGAIAASASAATAASALYLFRMLVILLEFNLERP
jgi:hypothetical protein